MVAAAYEHEGLAQDRHELDVGFLGPDVVEPELRLPMRAAREDLSGALTDDADADVRVAGLMPEERRWEEILHGGRDADHRDLAHPRRRQLANPQEEALEIVDERSRLVREVAPGGGQGDAPGGSPEQPHTECALELADAAAQRRLGQVERLGGQVKAPQLGHGDEGSKLGQVEIHAGDTTISRFRRIGNLQPRSTTSRNYRRGDRAGGGPA